MVPPAASIEEMRILGSGSRSSLGSSDTRCPSSPTDGNMAGGEVATSSGSNVDSIEVLENRICPVWARSGITWMPSLARLADIVLSESAGWSRFDVPSSTSDEVALRIGRCENGRNAKLPWKSLEILSTRAERVDSASAGLGFSNGSNMLRLTLASSGD